MYCGKCGIEIKAGAKFCSKCGTTVPVINGSEQGSETIHYEAGFEHGSGNRSGNSFSNFAQDTSEFNGEKQPASMSSSKRPSKRWLSKVVIAVCIIIILGTGGFLAVKTGLLPFGGASGDYPGEAVTYAELLKDTGVDSEEETDIIKSSYCEAMTVKFSDKLQEKNGGTVKKAQVTVPDMGKIYKKTTEEKEIIKYINEPGNKYKITYETEVPVDAEGRVNENTAKSILDSAERHYWSPENGSTSEDVRGESVDLLEQQNVNQHGFVAYSKGFYYYFDLTGDLTSESEKTGEKKILLHDDIREDVDWEYTNFNLIVRDDWLYYLHHDFKAFNESGGEDYNADISVKIARVKTDGSKAEVFENCDADWFAIENNTIYFDYHEASIEDGDNVVRDLRKANMDGTGIEKIALLDDDEWLTWQQDRYVQNGIFYAVHAQFNVDTDAFILSCDLNSGKLERFIESEEIPTIESLIILDDNFYITVDEQTESMNHKILIYDSRGNLLRDKKLNTAFYANIINDNEIIGSKYYDEWGLYMIPLNDESDEPVFLSEDYPVNVVNDTIFFKRGNELKRIKSGT